MCEGFKQKGYVPGDMTIPQDYRSYFTDEADTDIYWKASASVWRAKIGCSLYDGIYKGTCRDCIDWLIPRKGVLKIDSLPVFRTDIRCMKTVFEVMGKKEAGLLLAPDGGKNFWILGRDLFELEAAGTEQRIKCRKYLLTPDENYQIRMRGWGRIQLEVRS